MTLVAMCAKGQVQEKNPLTRKTRLYTYSSTYMAEDQSVSLGSNAATVVSTGLLFLTILCARSSNAGVGNLGLAKKSVRSFQQVTSACITPRKGRGAYYSASKKKRGGGTPQQGAARPRPPPEGNNKNKGRAHVLHSLAGRP